MKMQLSLLALFLLAASDGLRVVSSPGSLGRRAALGKLATLPVAVGLLSPSAAVAGDVCWGKSQRSLTDW